MIDSAMVFRMNGFPLLGTRYRSSIKLALKNYLCKWMNINKYLKIEPGFEDKSKPGANETSLPTLPETRCLLLLFDLMSLSPLRVTDLDKTIRPDNKFNILANYCKQRLTEKNVKDSSHSRIKSASSIGSTWPNIDMHTNPRNCLLLLWTRTRYTQVFRPCKNSTCQRR
jgi:hypothetical protein